MIEILINLLAYAGIALMGLLVWAAFSPFETLGWWAGWFGDKIYTDNLPADGQVRMVRPQANSYLIFLSGVSCVSGATVSKREQGFLQRLAQTLPNTVVIDDIFPYSVNNRALTETPIFAHFWQWVYRRKLAGQLLLGYLINVRNIWQVLMSADPRYGPLFNQATAKVILHTLLRYQYDPESEQPLFVVGYSGAGQIAVGAVTYLRERMRAPIYVLSLGGVFGSDPGLLAATHLYHLYGSLDRAHKLGNIDPGRWPFFPASPWHCAQRQGLISFIAMGPMGHTGAGGYLDGNRQLADGTSYIDHTVETVATLVRLHTA